MKIVLTLLLAPFSFLPLKWSQFIGSKLGCYLLKKKPNRAHVALRNIQVCFPECSHNEHTTLLAQCAEGVGQWYLEAAYFWFRDPQIMLKSVDVINPEILQEAYAKGTGVVLIVPHIGNWEVLNLYLPQHYPFGAVYKPASNQSIEHTITAFRRRTGSSFYPANTAGIRQAIHGLRRGELVSIMPDHLPSKETGIHAPFFGHSALTGKLTRFLLGHTQAETILATAIRKPKGEGFEIAFEPVSIDTRSEIAAATSINSAIENCIRLNPSQYQWVYKRFDHPPEGSENLYKYSGKN